MAVLRSAANPRVRRWQRLARDARARRAEGSAIVEGPRVVDAWLRHRGPAVCVLISESAQARAPRADAVVLSDAAMRSITDVRTPQGVAAEVRIPACEEPLSDAPACVFLDAVQDAGNVGAILRSACAFGVPDVVLGPGCADAWSPKVLRAAAGAHALLRIRESPDLRAAMAAFGGRVYWTSPRQGRPLAEVDFNGRFGWIFGSEGQGVDARLAAHSAGAVSIPMRAPLESLNVAAAAAICLHVSARGRDAQAPG